MSKHFVSIHTHSTFSLMDSISQPHYMTRRIAELDQKGMVISDHGNMNGFAEIQKAGKKNGIVVLPGVEFYVAIRGHEDKSERDTAHLTVWAHNIEGYRNLCRLQTRSFVEGYYYDPRVSLDMLAEHSEGLMASSGCLGGMLQKPLCAGNRTEAERRIKALSQIFDDRFWIEIQNHEIEEELANHAATKQIAKKFNLPIVAAHDSHYSDRENYIPHDVVICLRTNSKVGDPNRKMAYKPEEFFLKSADDMLARHEPAHVWESGRIFDMCDPVDITSKTFHIPHPVENPESELKSLMLKGAKERYGKLTPEIKERLRYEYDTICKAGFAPYLLIIEDIYRFARSKNIPAGSGRGSAAGSVACYCLGITNIDPLKYDLMFERFLDPNRVSQPDIDADFSAARRQEIIDYLRSKYGEDKVSQIVTFQTMGGRAAIRDCARALGHSLELSDKLAKMIPQEGSVTRDREERDYVQQALDTVKEFKAEYDVNPDAKEIVDMAISLEGILKATSLHAAGIVVADKPLGEYCPMITVSDDKKRLLATGYGMNELEEIGLLKVDVLGIRYLDVLDDAIRYAISDGLLPLDFTMDSIDVDSPSIYALLSAGNTAGVFQVEGQGLTGLLRSLKPDTFDDIATCISIFRPGPISQIPNLVKRKHGEEEIAYPHPSLKPVLKDTYGLVILQEQIIRIGQIIAGYSLTRADKLRKTIAKKVIEDMPKEKKDFIAGAVSQGHKEKWAKKLFESVIEPAARYAFGKSHAYAYADLTAKCLAGETVVPLLDGTTPTIRELSMREEPFWVYSCDGEQVVPGLGHHARSTGIKRIVKVTLDDGMSVKCTSDHRFMMRFGGWKEAGDLKSGDRLMPFYRKYRKSSYGDSLYESIYHPGLDNWEQTHRMVGRRMYHDAYFRTDKRHIDHINELTQDNRPENIAVLTHSQHGKKTMQDNWTKRRDVMVNARDKVDVEAKRKKCADARRLWWANRTPEQLAAHSKKLSEAAMRDSEKKSKEKKDWWANLSDQQRAEMKEKMSAGEKEAWASGKFDNRKKWGELKAEQDVLNHKVVSVEDCGESEVFDLTVDEHHNFAVGSGVFVHNCAWAKANIPVHYFTALLKSIEDHPKRDEKMTAYIADAREMGIAILPPDINQSDFSFTPIAKEKAVRFGLNGIKFVGSKAVQEIIAKREKEPFTEFFSTIERLKSQHTNSRMLEALIKSGAMDSLPGNRASKLASLPAAMERADMLREDQKRIAAGGKPVKRKKPIPEPIMVDTSEDKVQMLAGERELIGYYLSSHPYLDFASSVSASHTVQQAREVNNEEVTVGGIISRLTLHTTKKGKQQMAFGAIEDDKAVIEFVIFPRQFSKLANIVKLDAPLVLTGKVESNDEGDSVAAKLLVNNASPIARGLKKAAKSIEYEEVITLPAEGYLEVLQKARKRLNSTEGITDLKFILADGSEVKVVA